MFAGQMADLSKTKLPCDNGPYRDGKGALFEGGCRVAACANWPGHIKPQTVDGLIHAVDVYPTFAALAGASTAKCKPLDGLNVWDTIAKALTVPKSSTTSNRSAGRFGRALEISACRSHGVDLYNLAEDPYEKNVAAAHPDKVATMQERPTSARNPPPLALIYVGSVNQQGAAAGGCRGTPRPGFGRGRRSLDRG
jgi:arylsulfatase A-like enzyme